MNRRTFLKLVSSWFIWPQFGTSREWAGWIYLSKGSPARFETDLDPNDPQLRGRVAYLIGREGGFPPGWLRGFQESTADLFEGWKSWLPIIRKGF